MQFDASPSFIYLIPSFLAISLGSASLCTMMFIVLLAHESFGSIPQTFVLSGFTPRVLYHIVFVAFLVFGYTVNQHTVVVSSFPVVVCQLALFLCAPLLRLRLAVQFLSSGFIFSQCAMSEPLSSCTFSASGITAIPSRVKPCSLTSLPHAMV